MEKSLGAKKGQAEVVQHELFMVQDGSVLVVFQKCSSKKIKNGEMNCIEDSLTNTGVKKNQSAGWEGVCTTKMNKKYQKYLPVMSKV